MSKNDEIIRHSVSENKRKLNLLCTVVRKKYAHYISPNREDSQYYIGLLKSMEYNNWWIIRDVIKLSSFVETCLLRWNCHWLVDIPSHVYQIDAIPDRLLEERNRHWLVGLAKYVHSKIRYKLKISGLIRLVESKKK